MRRIRLLVGMRRGVKGLAMGMILEVFHIWGMVFVLIVVLKRLVKCLMAIGPRCLRCLMFDFSQKPQQNEYNFRTLVSLLRYEAFLHQRNIFKYEN